MAERSVSLKVYCEGGLDLRQDPYLNLPGRAIQLQNFEPAANGGYRRINGFSLWDSAIVPGQGKIKHVSALGSKIITAREDAVGGNIDWYTGLGSGWGSPINTDVRALGSVIINHAHYNWTGIERVIFVDGENKPARWDGTTWTLLNGAGGPADPSLVIEYKNHIFYAGYTANTGAILFCAPDDETDFTVGNGAGEIVIGDTVTGFSIYRDQLIIFCSHTINRLLGSSKSDFSVSQITRKLGCDVSNSISNIGGDVIYLAPDGLRLLSDLDTTGGNATSISQEINSSLLSYTTGNLSSGTIESKNQYRIFFPESSGTETNSRGFLGTFRKTMSGENRWEWGEIKGIRPSCVDSHETVAPMVHGGFDGYIYNQESGSTFNGTAIEAIYQTPDYDFAEEGVGKRKFIHRVTPYVEREGAATIQMAVLYDHSSQSVLQPATYSLTGTTSSTSTYGTMIYGTSTYGARANVTPRQPVSGSGFFVSLQFQSTTTTDEPFVISGFLIDAQLGGKR